MKSNYKFAKRKIMTKLKTILSAYNKNPKLVSKNNTVKKIKPKIVRKKSEAEILLSKLKNRKNYKVFLLSEYWQHVRMKVLRRDKFTCIRCGSKNNLEVHHETYTIHFKEHKNLNKLHTLCSNCHREFHLHCETA